MKADGKGVRVMEGVGEGPRVGDAVGEGVSVWDAVAVGDAVAALVAGGATVGVSEGRGDGNTVGKGINVGRGGGWVTKVVWQAGADMSMIMSKYRFNAIVLVTYGGRYESRVELRPYCNTNVAIGRL